MRQLRNIFACLVHESPECVLDLVRNLRALDPSSTVLLYDGGGLDLRNSAFPFERHGAVIHPAPRPMAWGRLHEFAFDAMEFALRELPFDTITIVDSDQLAARRGYSGYLAEFLDARPRAGMLGNSPGVQPRMNAIGPAAAAYQEFELWRPFLKQFPEGENKFAHWSFWPSTVFTESAAREMCRLRASTPLLDDILSRTRIWATEEVVLPTLVALLGYEIAASPCSYEYVRYRTAYTAYQLELALNRPDVFWVHPVPRLQEDPLRRRIRERFNHYQPTPEPLPAPTGASNGLVLTTPILARMRSIEGWLDDEEADLLIAGLARALSEVPRASAVVEVGSYCGRSTVVLASVIQALASSSRVYAIDPHDGRVGALDQGLQYFPPTLDRFRRNIAAAGLAGTIETVPQAAHEVAWDRPVGFLFIDGLHDYASVARDFHHFEHWLVPGAYIAFHDYADYFPGVKSFVNELLRGAGYERIHSARSLVLLEKKAAADGCLAAPAVVPAQPLVSCLMPTADRRAFVPHAIRYFLRQDYPRRELIILDDGADPVRDLVPPDPRIRYVRMEQRRSMGAKHNMACELAHGEVIVHWDDDDWMAPWRLSYQVRELLQQPPMTLSGLARLLFYEPATGRAWEYVYPCRERPWVCGGSFCYRREFWESHHFPDMNEGADTVFVWGLNGVNVFPLEDHTFLVATVHPHNTSPKRTEGSAWRPYSPELIQRLIGADAISLTA